MPSEMRVVVGGVDTHKDVHVAAVVDERGKILDTASFATTTRGYRELVSWLRSFGDLVKVGVEGTGASGAGLSRHLGNQGLEVVEVNRPNRQDRRRRGKSDTVDAEATARAALNGEASVVPKTQGAIVESIRALRVAFTSARNSRTRVALQIRDLIVTAPDPLRGALGALSTAQRVARCARFQRSGDIADPVVGTKLALGTLARRDEALSAEMASSRRASTSSPPGPIRHFGAQRASGPTWPRSCSPQRATTPRGLAANLALLPCAACRRSKRRRERPFATASTARGIARRTMPCGAW